MNQTIPTHINGPMNCFVLPCCPLPFQNVPHPKRRNRIEQGHRNV